MKRSNKKLTLRADTVRMLSGQQLSEVGGGQMNTYANSGCISGCVDLCATWDYDCSTGIPCDRLSGTRTLC
jgi:hypothetical protein